MTFIAEYRNSSENNKDALWFIYNEQRLLVRQENDKYIIPRSSDLNKMRLDLQKGQFFGLMDGLPCYFSEIKDNMKPTGNLMLIGLRELFATFDEDYIRAAGMAKQLLHWSLNHTYCGRCGHHTEKKEDERAKICPKCGLVNYTRLSPAMIVAIIKNGRILLASSQRFPGKFYSVLAGFVEPGETLEECVKREVREEVGITVKNIKYFGSQSWPFPDSLMIAFTAEYSEGVIEIDGTEIADAKWFSRDELPSIPSIPPSISIARQLIDWFIENY